MLAVICMLAFVSAGGVVGSAFFKKRYEETNYVSVINNGVVLASASGEQRVECQDRFDFGHTYNAWLDGAEGQIIVDGLDYSTNRRGINIVVYDNKTNCVIDTVNIDTYTDDQIVRRYI